MAPKSDGTTFGISTDYQGSPLMGGGSSYLTAFDVPGDTGAPGATPGAGLDPSGFALKTPESGGGGDFDWNAANQIGGAVLESAGTLISQGMQNAALEDAQETARQMEEQRLADEKMSMRQGEKLLDVGTAQAAESVKQRSKEFDLKKRHNSFMRAVAKEVEKQGQLQGLLDKFAGRAYSNAELKNRFIRRQVRA